MDGVLVLYVGEGSPPVHARVTDSTKFRGFATTAKDLQLGSWVVIISREVGQSVDAEVVWSGLTYLDGRFAGTATDMELVLDPLATELPDVPPVVFDPDSFVVHERPNRPSLPSAITTELRSIQRDRNSSAITFQEATGRAFLALQGTGFVFALFQEASSSRAVVVLVAGPGV